MARPKQSIHARVARHTGLSEDIIHAGNHECWEWKGAFHPKTAKVTSSNHKLRHGLIRRRPRPQLEGVGHPVRGLLGVDDRYVRVSNRCGNEKCVNPTHFRAEALTSIKEGRMGQLPSKFTEYEEAMIGWILDELAQGQTPDPVSYPQQLIDEALRRQAEGVL